MGGFVRIGLGFAVAALAIETQPAVAQFPWPRSTRGQMSSRNRNQCPPGTVPATQHPYCPPVSEPVFPPVQGQTDTTPNSEMPPRTSPSGNEASERPSDPSSPTNQSPTPNTPQDNATQQQPQTLTDQALNAPQENAAAPNSAFSNFGSGGSSAIGRGAAPFAGDFLGFTNSGSLDSALLATPPGTILAGPSLDVAGFIGGSTSVTLNAGRVLNGAADHHARQALSKIKFCKKILWNFFGRGDQL